MKRLRKRALVVVLSDLRDEDDDTLAPGLRLLQSRHLVLFASLREGILSRALAARVDSFDRALTHAATAENLQRRELAFRRLERGGAVCLDVEPADLPIALVNRYIDINAAGGCSDAGSNASPHDTPSEVAERSRRSAPRRHELPRGNRSIGQPPGDSGGDTMGGGALPPAAPIRAVMLVIACRQPGPPPPRAPVRQMASTGRRPRRAPRPARARRARRGR